MAIPTKDLLSLEAIQFQGHSLLFKELTLAVERLRASKNISQPGIDALNLSALIKKHTGMIIVPHLASPGMIYHAMIGMPVLALSGGQVHNMFKYVPAGLQYDFEEQVRKHITTFTGAVDLKKCKVSGFFSEIEFSLELSSDVWNGMVFTAEETAAIILHELGHAFTYCETFAQTCSVNYAISSAIQELNRTDDLQRRMAIVDATGRVLDVPLEDKQSLAQPGKEEVFQAVLIRGYVRQVMSATDASAYDYRGSEFLADQFAARHGAARQLAIALDKIDRAFGSTIYRSVATHVIIEAYKCAMLVLSTIFIVTIPFVVLLVVMRLTLRDADHHSYDAPGERLDRLQAQMVQELKLPKLSPERRETLLEDIQTLTTLREQITDHRTAFTYLWIACTARRRAQQSQIEFQQGLEKIINNTVFVQAAKLTQLAS